MKTLSMLIILSVSSLGLTACGNIFADRNLVSRQLSQMSGGLVPTTGNGTNGTVYDSGFECSYTNTILPNQTNYTGGGEYRVCTDPTSIQRVRLNGATFFENTVCVYPIQYVDGQGVFLKKDPRSEDEIPYYDCQNITGTGGNVFAFNTTAYNGLIVVENSMNESYLQCLTSGDAGACDPFVLKFVSSGRFR